MKIVEVTLRKVSMDLVTPFQTSFGTEEEREFILLEAKDESGLVGWGESVAMKKPYYNEETCGTNWHMLEKFIIPTFLHHIFEYPYQVPEELAKIRGNNMAKAAMEAAVWDIYAQMSDQSLAQMIGGEKEKIEAGVSLGIQESVEDLLKVVRQQIWAGYKRIKLKIKPGWDVDVIRAVREQFPDIQLMVDANSAYTLADIDVLKQLDAFNLMMIEQPLASDDIVDHATLQKQLETPICLDESIRSLEDARKAIEIGSAKIINIKIGRVGGLTEAKKIHDYCLAHDVPVWCGGMLESGIGRAHNIALASLTNFTLPGDISESSRYWKKDIIEPEIVMEDGYLKVPKGPGMGYQVNKRALDRMTLKRKVML